MNYLRLPASVFSRRRPLAAACLLTVAAAMLWTGFGGPTLLPTPAVADASPADPQAVPPVVSSERAGLLQSSVDSVALGLGSALETLADDGAKQAALAKALTSLTFELGGEVYFTAWQGTHIIHSPLTPDIVDMDFSDALDERGTTFVRTMESVAGSGGGFVRVTLPRQLQRQSFMGPVAGGSTVSTPLQLDDEVARKPLGTDILSSAHLEDKVSKAVFSRRAGKRPVVLRGSGETAYRVDGERDAADNDAVLTQDAPFGSKPLPDAAPVEQVVYVRPIPQSSWHIAAFMPAEASDAEVRGFSPAWSVVAEDHRALQSDRDFRQGLCVSGFSLAGMAGLLLLPGRREDDPELDA